MKHVRKSLVLLVALVIAVVNLSLVVAQSDDNNLEPSEEVTLTDEALKAETENCATILGQAYVPSGIEEGVVADPPPATTVNPSTLFAATNFDPVASNRTAVAILVIDEFNDPSTGTPLYQLPSDVYKAGQDVDLQPFMDAGALSHGAQVFNHINALLEPVLTSTVSNPYSPTALDDRVEWTDSSGNRVVVKMVDALTYQVPTVTSEVATKIAQAMVELSSEGITHFVLNMSFAIVPCAVARDRIRTKDTFPTFNEYTAEVHSKFPTLEANLLIRPVGSNDPLFAFFQTCPSDTYDKESPYLVSLPNDPLEGGDQPADPEIVLPGDLQEMLSGLKGNCDTQPVVWTHIGAAGNSGLPYPFYPARWVKSVSAATNGSLDTSYSNSDADKGLEGGWFNLVDWQTSDGDPTTPLEVNPNGHVFYRGTSFSAPVESVCQALGIPDSDFPCTSVSPS